MDQLKRAVYRLGRFIPVGPRYLSEGLEVCCELQAHGIPSTLGKFCRKGDALQPIVQECQVASNTLKSITAGGRFYLSLKPPALGFDIEPVMAIATTALANGHGIHFDSHEYCFADSTIQLLEQVIDRNILPNNIAEGWTFGLVLPTRWKRSMADAEWAIKKGVRVRLVKGEFRSPLPSEKMDPVKGFLSLVDRLAGNIPEIAVATHDYALAREAIKRCKDAGCMVQLELLFGMPIGNMMALSQEMGVPVRFYVPYGEDLFIYGTHHFLTNPHKLLRPGLLEVFSGHRSKLARIVRSV